MAYLTSPDDTEQLAVFDSTAVECAVEQLEEWLDYFASPWNADAPIEPVVNAIIAAAGVEDNDDRRMMLRIALPSQAPTFLRDPPGLLAALIRLV